MRRDDNGRRTFKRCTNPIPEDPPEENWAGDNLASTDDDHEHDENAAFNWSNNPIRQLFDNPTTRSERSHLHYDP